ncbi:hypothetical protein ACA910_014699 [Epithemia clementina (nom. ined.)]
MAQRFSCSPCLDRSTFTIRAYATGDMASDYWKQVQASMTQAAADMKVDFAVEMFSDSTAMAASIASVTADALIVDIVDDTVKAAVSSKATAGTPIFGFQNGYQDWQTNGVTGFVGMDDIEAGEKAAAKLSTSLAPMERPFRLSS